MNWWYKLIFSIHWLSKLNTLAIGLKGRDPTTSPRLTWFTKTCQHQRNIGTNMHQTLILKYSPFLSLSTALSVCKQTRTKPICISKFGTKVSLGADLSHANSWTSCCSVTSLSNLFSRWHLKYPFTGHPIIPPSHKRKQWTYQIRFCLNCFTYMYPEKGFKKLVDDKTSSFSLQLVYHEAVMAHIHFSLPLVTWDVRKHPTSLFPKIHEIKDDAGTDCD